MLRTRLWMGALLIALTAGVLTVDQRFARWYPFLFVLVLALTLLACVELLHLIRPGQRPSAVPSVRGSGAPSSHPFSNPMAAHSP